MNKKEIANVYKRPDGIFEIELFGKPLRTQIAELKEENKALKEQLAEKDNEINKLKDNLKDLKEERDELAFEKRNIFGLIEKVSIKNQLEIRKQVCDEIRDFIGKYDVLKPKQLFVMDLFRKLVRIEKGE